MLELSLFEFLVRTIPESFIIIFAVYTFSKTKLDKRYILSSSMLSILIFFIRKLPISYGVHTILNIITILLLVSAVNKIEIVKGIQSSILSSILLFICEGINVLSLKAIIGSDINTMFENNMLKTILGLPSLIVFFIIVIIFYCKKVKGSKVQNV